MRELYLDEFARTRAMDVRDLVNTIMCECGLGFEPDWYNGSSCMISRRQAVKKLRQSIKKHHDAGVHITPPLAPLFRQLVEVIKREERETPNHLHRTWQTVRLIILKHIELASVRRNTDRAMAVNDAKERIAGSFDTPQTDEEKEYARRHASILDPDGMKAFRNRKR